MFESEPIVRLCRAIDIIPIENENRLLLSFGYPGSIVIVIVIKKISLPIPRVIVILFIREFRSRFGE